MRGKSDATMALPATRTYRVLIEGATELLFGAPKHSERAADEDAYGFDRRTAHERVHEDSQGRPIMLGVALQKALAKAAKRRGEKIPGRGASNFTSRFAQGVFVRDAVIENGSGTELLAKDIPLKDIFVPLQPGMKNSGKGFRVFPYLVRWSIPFDVLVFDNLITEEILHRHLLECGMFCGLGSMNVGNGNNNGRFRVVSLELINAI